MLHPAQHVAQGCKCAHCEVNHSGLRSPLLMNKVQQDRSAAQPCRLKPPQNNSSAVLPLILKLLVSVIISGISDHMSTDHMILIVGNVMNESGSALWLGPILHTQPIFVS